MNARQLTASNVMAEPGRYCVCCCCGSILMATVRSACPACNGYRFERDPAHVVLQASRLAEKAQSAVGPGDLA